MSTATASDFTAPLLGGRRHFLLRRLHSLTGVIFGGYVVIHLLVNATLIQGRNPDVYQTQVNKIHDLPFLWAVEWVFIYLPIIYHTIYGIWIIATGQPNVAEYPFAKNYLYLLQRVSAIILAAFIAFHVFAMKGVFTQALTFDPANATATAERAVAGMWFLAYVVYPLGVLAGCFHLANGFWTAGITWGLTVSKGGQRRWGVVCACLFGFTLLCGFLALAACIAKR